MTPSSPLLSSLFCSSHPQLTKRFGDSQRYAIARTKKERSRGALNSPDRGCGQVINHKLHHPERRWLASCSPLRSLRLSFYRVKSSESIIPHWRSL